MGGKSVGEIPQLSLGWANSQSASARLAPQVHNPVVPLSIIVLDSRSVV